MQNRILKAALLAVLALILVLGLSATSFAAGPWSDLPDTVTTQYGITNDQVATISQGYPNGLWQPCQNITRAQFTKMAVEAFDIDLVDPDVATFTDVAKGSSHYQYVEAAKAAGIISGTGTGETFSPEATITRVQAIAIIARHVAEARGYDLATAYTEAEISDFLANFADRSNIATDFYEEVAFARDFGITTGDAYGNLTPASPLMRIQAAALLIRAQEKASAEPTTITQQFSETNTADSVWVADLTTAELTAYTKISVFDQFGEPTTADKVKVMMTGPWNKTFGPMTVEGTKVVTEDFSNSSGTTEWVAGSYDVVPWIDADEDGIIDEDEVTGQTAHLTLQ